MADEKMIRVRLVRARWDETGQRIDAGTELVIPATAALEGVELGLLETVKPEKKG